jgi:hypothetical protein
MDAQRAPALSRISEARNRCDELLKQNVAQLGAAHALDQARVPILQFPQIQAGGVAVYRWPAQHVCGAAGSLHVLLAALLLVCTA